jgi:hypothetical protein
MVTALSTMLRRCETGFLLIGRRYLAQRDFNDCLGKAVNGPRPESLTLDLN